jgi:hypothetical protein
MEWNGVEIRRLYLPTVESYGGVRLRVRASNLTAGAPGSTFFFALNPDVREIVLSS